MNQSQSLQHSNQIPTIMQFIITCFLLIPHVISLQFNYTFNSPQNYNPDEIVLEGEGSYISDDGIHLTPDRNRTHEESPRAGRMTYFKELHLWDSKSNQLASFSTNFTFVIDSNNSSSEYGYGLTFFLAQNSSLINPRGDMGLPTTASNSANRIRFVAVEFDTFRDSWDPSGVGDHVGINKNLLASADYENWFSNVTGGGVCEAWVRFDSGSNILSVSFTGYQDNTVFRQDGLAYAINLRKELPEQVIFGFSAAAGPLFQRNIVRSWSFESTDLGAGPGPGPVKGGNDEVGLIVGLPVTISFVVVLSIILWRLKGAKGRGDEGEDVDVEFDIEMNKDFEMGCGPKRFSYNELARSTGDFDSKEKLGEGGFGDVYRGFLSESHSYVAVKRMSKTSKQGIKQYASEVRIISRLRHKNLVPLVGWCHENHELLLVYEYMENGSLDSHLFKGKSLLAWGTRCKIARGLASALLYLHQEWEQCVLHRDIKSSNVMLDSNFNAKLGDFGLAKLVDHDEGVHTTMLAGTLGYMAPECVVTGKASKESDVYSFGVVVLEIACGRKAIEPMVEETQTRLVEWVWGLYGAGALLDALDPRIGSGFENKDIKQLMIIGLWCAHPDSSHRPSMRQVVQVLNSEASLPILPSKMPVASYLTPSMSSQFSVAPVSQNQSSCVVSNSDSSKQMTSSTTSSCSPYVSLL